MSDDLEYEIAMRTCEFCNKDYDWIYSCCPYCFPGGVLDYLQWLTGSKKGPDAKSD